MGKFDDVRKELDSWWGFRIHKNDKSARGYWHGCWKTGYTVTGRLRGSFQLRFDSLAQIERSWLFEHKRKADAP